MFCTHFPCRTHGFCSHNVHGKSMARTGSRFLTLRLSHCSLFPSLGIDSIQHLWLLPGPYNHRKQDLTHSYLKTHRRVTSSGEASIYHSLLVISQHPFFAPFPCASAAYQGIDSLNRNCGTSYKRNTSFSPQYGVLQLIPNVSSSIHSQVSKKPLSLLPTCATPRPEHTTFYLLLLPNLKFNGHFSVIFFCYRIIFLNAKIKWFSYKYKMNMCQNGV